MVHWTKIVTNEQRGDKSPVGPKTVHTSYLMAKWTSSTRTQGDSRSMFSLLGKYRKNYSTSLGKNIFIWMKNDFTRTPQFSNQSLHFWALAYIFLFEQGKIGSANFGMSDELSTEIFFSSIEDGRNHLTLFFPYYWINVSGYNNTF